MVSNARLDLPDPDSPVITMNFSRGRVRLTFFRLCSRAPLMTILSFAKMFSSLSLCLCMACAALGLGVRVHGGVLAPAQPVDLVPQEGRVLEFQQLCSLLHLAGQTLDGGLPLLLAHAAGAGFGILGLVADLDGVPDLLDDGPGHDAMGLVVSHLDGAAALGLGDGPLHA